MSSVVKLGPWGSGDHGSAYDITVAPQRLESISFGHGYIVDCVSFTYRDRDGKLHTAGPWGGAAGRYKDTVTLGTDEYVTEVAGAVGPFVELTHTVAWLKIVTNRATYGPFGHGEGTPFNVPVLNNGIIVGMFARADQYLDAIGFYVLPAAPLPAIKPAADPADQKENHKDSTSQEENHKDAASQEEKDEEKSGQEEEKEKDASQEEKEKEKSTCQEAKEKDSIHEEKENGKS